MQGGNEVSDKYSLSCERSLNPHSSCEAWWTEHHGFAATGSDYNHHNCIKKFYKGSGHHSFIQVGDTRRQWCKTHNHISNRMVKKKEKKKNLYFGMAKNKSPDLKPTQMRWHDQRSAFHARNPWNIDELKQFVKWNVQNCIWSAGAGSKSSNISDQFSKWVVVVTKICGSVGPNDPCLTRH